MNVKIWDKENEKFVDMKNVNYIYNGTTFIGIHFKDGNVTELTTLHYDLLFVSD